MSPVRSGDVSLSLCHSSTNRSDAGVLHISQWQSLSVNVNHLLPKTWSICFVFILTFWYTTISYPSTTHSPIFLLVHNKWQSFKWCCIDADCWCVFRLSFHRCQWMERKHGSARNYQRNYYLGEAWMFKCMCLCQSLCTLLRLVMMTVDSFMASLSQCSVLKYTLNKWLWSVI